MTRWSKSPYANRGMVFEEEIEFANKQYERLGKANVAKIPIPIKVQEINNNKITKAFFEKKSTVDYIGSYKGQSIAFDAKKTNVTTRFDLGNLEENQFEFLRSHHKTGAISFLLIYFKELDEYHIVFFPLLREYWNKYVTGRRSSIPIEVIRKRGKEVNDIMNYLDELEAIENE